MTSPMFSTRISRARRQRSAAAFAALALLGSAPLSAGLLTTDRTVANFVFKGGEVDYRPDAGRLLWSAAGAASLASRLPDLGGESTTALDPLGGALHLDAGLDNFGNLDRGDFNLFGSLPAAATLPDGALLDGAVSALREDSKTGGVDGLQDLNPVTGPLASQYRSIGIFMLVDGVDQGVWIAGYKDAASTQRLVSLEDAAADGAQVAGAIPVPNAGSLALLAAGLPLLGRRRSRPGSGDR